MIKIPLHSKEYVLDVRNADLGSSQFDNVTMADTTFKDASFERARFQLARFAGAMIRFTSMAGCSFEAVDFSGATFRNCRYAGMVIEGVPVEDLLTAYRQGEAIK